MSSVDARVRTALVWAGCLTGAAAAWGAAAVAHVTGLPQSGARIADAVVVSAYALVGAVVLASRPRHRVGRLLMLGAVLWGLGSFVLELLVARLTDDPSSRAAVAAAVVAFGVRGLGFVVLLGVLPLVFPDGRLPSPGWERPVRWLLTALLVTFVVGTLLLAGNPDQRLTTLPNPLSPPGWAFAIDLVYITAMLLLAGTVVLGLVAVAVRWRRSRPRPEPPRWSRCCSPHCGTPCSAVSTASRSAGGTTRTRCSTASATVSPGAPGRD